jgi:orotidine-5'-phosphate decarboxylase
MAPPIIEAMSPSSLEKMRERLIVALDVANANAARETVQRLGEAAGIYKIGLQLFTAEGPGIVREMVASGRRVFLDLKLHDIPNTVAHAVKSVVELGPSMITVHASGGAAMLRAAVEAAGGRTKVLAVTVLTSFSDHDLQQIGIPDRSGDQVLRLATLAQAAGCAGVVSSPRETAQLRKFFGDGFDIVNPGVRPAGTDTHDQQRTATPSEAIAAGASHIVVGRPITHASDPVLAVQAIVNEMANAFSGRGSS